MKRLDIKLSQGDYPIYIGRDIIENLGEELKKIYSNKRIVIITDNKVRGLYSDKIIDSLKNNGFETHIISVEPGEKSKSINTAEYIYNKLLDFSINRRDLIITFGGGVVGDLGGFVASTYMRGIPFVQVPTTLLAQVDSSVGGKVAVNLPRGKNLIGSFYHPKAVFIDVELLQTLDSRVFSDGMAEVIKYGCIKSPELFQKLFKYDVKDIINNIEDIIYSCCKIKGEIVERDEREKGERMLLNFGHTLGHVIEKHFNYEKYTHGEGVAIGMYNITKTSEELGITEKGSAEKIKELLIRYKLPYKMPEIDKEEIIKSVILDKKSEGNNINLVLLDNIGSSFIKRLSIDEFEKFL